MARSESDDGLEVVRRLRDAMSTGDTETVAAVASEFTWQLVTRHYDLLLEVLDGLPLSVLERYENLKLVHPVTPTLMRAQFQYPEAGARVERNALDGRQRDESLATLLVSRRLHGNVKLSLEAAERLSERLREGFRQITATESSLAAQFRFQIGYTYLLDGQTGTALQSFSAARQLAELDPTDHSQRDAVSRSAVTHAFRGSLWQAQRDLDRSRALPDGAMPFGAFISTAERIAEALIDLERMSPDLDTRMTELDSYDSVDELWPFIALIRARYELTRRHPMAALDAISLAFETHRWQPDTMAADIRASCLVHAFLALGEVAAARDICEEAGTRLPLTRIAHVRVLIFEGNFAEATRECRSISGAQKGSVAVRTEAMLLLAWVTYQMEKELELSDARSVADLALTGDFRRLFSTLPKDLIDAVCEALPDAEAERVRTVLADIEFAVPLPQRPKLSPSEMRVLEELVDSTKTAEIAERLFVTQNTVKTQLASIYRKLGVRNRADAITLATRLSLFG
ncbi:MAG: LuxR C-terminal-related transcriptional regulator [Microbacterium sp.]